MNNSLKTKLEERKAAFALNADDNKKRAYRQGIDEVRVSGITTSAKQVGDVAPDFNLYNAESKLVSLSDILKEGPVILNWYRGGWCPYCNMTLQALQQELANYQSLGAQLIAITPELPDNSLTTKEKNELQFEVLSDIGNKVAKEYGIVFKLNDEVAGMYNNAFALNDHNGDLSNELPLAATYLIDKAGVIQYAFLDHDYRNRPEPSEITQILRTL